ncbi:helix-hairpin-helix domain-containing protein [Salmonella enterica]|nr:helix-hairpin-helix domain-containing protein [Salmonella enterica]
MPHKKVALQLIEETLKELESPKGSLLSAIQKLQRTADIINDEDTKIWCAIQLGETKYTKPITELLKFVIEAENTKNKSFQENLDKRIQELAKLGVKANIHYSDEELTLKNIESGGGYNNIGFIEEKYADLVRKKQGNDGTYYKNSLNQHINYVRKKAHELASQIYNQLKFSGTVSNCFDVLKNAVDDKLLDLNPVIAEQLMLAFKAISSDKEEEWSQALTTCRRLLEGLADELYPASKEKFNGRAVGQGQYVNRLWAFMDGAIQSESNKDLAKAHIDFLGSWLDKVNKLINKGVHAELDRIEAVKSVFHMYLVVADLLEYMSNTKTSVSKPDINKATLDELEALLNINRTIAKEIVKARVREGKLDLDILKSIKGIGAKTLSNIQEVFVL